MMAMALRLGEFRAAWLWRSLASRLVLLVLVFVSVPMLIYDQFRRADEIGRELLLQSAQQQGELIARAIEPELARTDRGGWPRLGGVLARFADEHTRLKLLVRPRSIKGGDGFFYVGAAPVVASADLDAERRQLLEEGVLDRVGDSCAGNAPLALRVPHSAGGTEVLTSITPLNTAFGCWVLITSHATADYLGSSLGQPYWRTAVVQAAALIYLGMAALVLAVLLGVWRNLHRFGDLARIIVGGEADGSGQSFAARNTLPELAGVAEDFDRLVATLRHSAEAMRRAAEDNAHAFKTPIAVIRQSVEPLKRALTGDDARCRRALTMIERSVDRLDGLVSFARRMDETAAALLEPPRRKIDLSALVERMAGGYTGLLTERRLHIRSSIERGVVVRASEEILETVLENIIENAVSFSPAGGTVRVRLARGQGRAELVVEDEGPGVDPDNLPRIFERYFSQREPGRGAPPALEAPGASAAGGAASAEEPHYGIGLWIVRRNVEAVGGLVSAGNRQDGRGFCLRITLPLAH
jgi:two-component system sensor histidine kinase ChvG